MTAQFTPGPWRIEPHAKFGRTHMYWVNDLTSVGTEVEPDVRLIAAAPELYEALHDALEVLYASGNNVEQKWIDALAKARGDA